MDQQTRDWYSQKLNEGAVALVEGVQLERKLRERAWAAGLFDGEGSSHFRKGTRAAEGRGYKNGSQVKITVQQNDREVLDRFQSAVNAGVVYGPYSRSSARGRSYAPYFTFQAHTYEEVKQIYEALRPFLGSIKLTQLEQSIRGWEEYHVGA